MDFLQQLPIPFGKIISFFWNDYEKKLFQPTLRKSHQIYCNRHYSLNFFSITENLDIDFILENVFSNERRPCSQIVLKNTGKQEITSLDISVRTTSGYGKEYEDRFQISNLCSNKLRYLNLIHIPLVEIWYDEQLKAFYLSHGNLDVRIHSIEVDNIITKNPEQENISLISTAFSSLLENEWVKKWDYTWNIHWIRLAQSRLAMKLDRTNNIVLKLAAKNKQIITILFWILIFKGQEFNHYGDLVEE